MAIATPEEYAAAYARWESYELEDSWIGLAEDQKRQQLAIEREMADSPFEYGEDDEVIRKASSESGDVADRRGRG